MAWLMDVQIKPWLSKKRQRFVEDVIRLYEVEQAGGQLVRPIEDISEIVTGVVGLGQACVRVADLVFTKRSVMVTAFAEQIEEALVRRSPCVSPVDDAECVLILQMEVMTCAFGEVRRQPRSVRSHHG